MSASSPRDARLHLRCQGVVQGVGARPALKRLALQLHLRGCLRNRFGALEIHLCGARMALDAFLEALPSAFPQGMELGPIEAVWLAPPSPPWPDGVHIGVEGVVPLGQALIAPGLAADRAPCPRCQKELADPANRRHRYPFISCCDCGPRFSLATALPFCRAHTTLAAFSPCADCAREFANPRDRRFHSETISCPACGPSLVLMDGAGRPQATGDGALEASAQLLIAGQILALQGVGGFQLLVDGTAPQAVMRLRRRKRRPAKPLALLVADPAQLEGDVVLSAAEERALRHPAAPIVLLRRRHRHGQQPWQAVAPGSPALGLMLPASGLHQLLVEQVGRPLVATSGNRSGEPLCIHPGEAVQRLEGIADAFLVHDLPLARPLDDSLLQLVEGGPVLLRRARGFVPEPLPWHGPSSRARDPSLPSGVLASGGDLKAAPALVMEDRVWLAPHLGDLADVGVQGRWMGALEAQLHCPALPITAVACDAHPGYVSHQLLGPLCEEQGLPLIPVPHHLAHGLAVLAESGRQPPVLVVACDGLGLGDPGGIQGHERLWGGELLFIHGLPRGDVRWERLAALRPFPLPGGEKASREPRRCALGLLAAYGADGLAHPGAAHALGAFSTRERQLLLQAIAAQCNAPQTSSLGRFLDGMVSLLGLAQTLSYEGEGGLRWQGVARLWDADPWPLEAAGECWPFPLRPCEAGALPLGRWDWKPLLWALLEDRAAGGSPAHAAWRIEQALVEGLAEGAAAAAALSGCRLVALAGGCFQNRPLLESCAQALRRRSLEPIWSHWVPCNDGGLALGQAWAAQAARSGL